MVDAASILVGKLESRNALRASSYLADKWCIERSIDLLSCADSGTGLTPFDTNKPEVVVMFSATEAMLAQRLLTSANAPSPERPGGDREC
jgi:hypothetical protein